MRCEPHARGGSHHPNYERDAKFLSILFPDVDRSNAIPVPRPATRLVRAGKDAPPWLALAAVTAHRTGTRRVVFVLEYNAHPQSLSLVGELVAHRATRPLVDFLVIGGANIIVLADISNIANHDDLDALMIQRRDKSRGAFVFDILDLMLQFVELLLLGSNELLTPLGAFLLTGNTAIQVCHELVAILSLGAREPSIENVGVFPIVGNRHVDFAQVDACHLLALRMHLCFFQAVGSNRFVLCARPVDDHRLRQLPGPIEDERGISLAVGKLEHSIFQTHGTALVFYAEVPFALAWWLRLRVALATFSP